MFKCHFCGKVSQPREPKHMVPVVVRQKFYPVLDRETGEVVDETVGAEIVEEKPGCGPCAQLVVAKQLAAEEPETFELPAGEDGLEVR